MVRKGSSVRVRQRAWARLQGKGGGTNVWVPRLAQRGRNPRADGPPIRAVLQADLPHAKCGNGHAGRSAQAAGQRWPKSPAVGQVFETVTEGYLTPGICRDFADPDVAVGKWAGKSVLSRRDLGRRIGLLEQRLRGSGDRWRRPVWSGVARVLRLGAARPRGPP